MNNRYLYRAKTRGGLWVQGFLSRRDNKYYISNKAGMPFAYEVVEDTICQCIGRKDKDGNLIFEHDIVKEYNSERIGEVKFGEHEKGYGWYIAWISEKAKYYRADFLYWQKKIGLTVIENAFNIPADWKKPEKEDKRWILERR